MKTIQAIVELAGDAQPGDVLTMATVMKIRGSAYRRPGARMLMLPDGRTAGMISGGCLENDVRERAQAVRASGTQTLVTYDSTAPEDIVFGLGLGCNGIVEVLIEPVIVGDPAGLLAFLASCVARRQIGRVATVFHAETAPLGARVLRWPDGSVTENFRDAALSSALRPSLHAVAARRTALRKIDLAGAGFASVLVEAITPPLALTIFGAADDAIPVVRLAKSLGWNVTVIDARPAYATPARFPDADGVHCLRAEALLASPLVVLPPTALALIMTHHFSQDLALLRGLLPRGLRYIGILGPKSRTQRLLDELGDDGVVFPPEHLARLHGPVGLDIGAETPEEIAVSIIGEMQAVLAQRSGGALRDRSAPIHDPTESALIPHEH